VGVEYGGASIETPYKVRGGREEGGVMIPSRTMREIVMLRCHFNSLMYEYQLNWDLNNIRRLPSSRGSRYVKFLSEIEINLLMSRI